MNFTTQIPVLKRWTEADGTEFFETGPMIIFDERAIVSVRNSVWQVPTGWFETFGTRIEIDSVTDDATHYKMTAIMPKLVRVE